MAKETPTHSGAMARCETLTPEGVRVVAREDGSPSRTIEGYAIVFGVESRPLWQDEDGEAREVIAPGAVTRDMLDSSDIKMTMYHNREKLLARSRPGAASNTLAYEIDERGVKFRFEAPDTALGDEALALVSRGDISGCSFIFGCYYGDKESVERRTEEREGKLVKIFTVQRIEGVYDFTLASDPAYPSTTVSRREAAEAAQPEKREEPQPQPARPSAASAEMLERSKRPLRRYY